MLQSQGPVNWDAARQFAVQVATGGTPEANIDPLERIRLEELARVADLQVVGRTGLATAVDGRSAVVVPATRTAWVMRSLEAYRGLFEAMANASRPAPGTGLPPGFGPGEPGQALDPDTAGSPEAFLGGILQLLSPMLLGMSAGSMLGHLSRRSFGQYDLPVPRPRSHELLVVSPTIEAFVEEWSVPGDDVRLWVCVHELTHHAVFGVPHVHARLTSLLERYASAFEPDPTVLQERLEGIETSDPAQGLASLQEALGDPEVLLGAVQSAEQRALVPELDAVTAVVTGYVDHVLDEVSNGLIASRVQLSEALRRRRVEEGPSQRMVERLLGLTLDPEQVERGSSFVSGVLERAGEQGLARLWDSERELPTPAEVDAPGLWLARIDLPES